MQWRQGRLEGLVMTGHRWGMVRGLAGMLSSLFLVAGTAPGPASAQDKAGISVELNNAEAQEQGCRVSFLFRSGLPAKVDEMALEVVLFDAGGKVVEFLVLNVGSLPPGKSRVRQFDLRNRACETISRLLVNDVKSCRGAELTPESCLRLLTVTSTAPLKLEM